MSLKDRVYKASPIVYNLEIHLVANCDVLLDETTNQGFGHSASIDRCTKKAPALLAQELFYYRTLEGFYWLSTGIASPVYCVFVTCSVALNALMTLLFASNSA